jgi:hypothetical protein
MAQNQRIEERLAPGIYRIASGGFRVPVAVGDWKRGGQQRDTTFPAGTALRKNDRLADSNARDADASAIGAGDWDA